MRKESLFIRSIIAGLTAVLLSFSCFATVRAEEEPLEEYRTIDFTVDRIGYRFLDDGTVALTNGDSASGEYTIPSSVTYEGVSYPVTVIEGGAFWKNENLTKLTIPSSVKELGDMKETGREIITYEGKNGNTIVAEWAESVGECPNLLEVEFSEGLEIIGGGCFNECPKITRIDFPDTLKEIRNGAFYGCPGLTNIHVTSNLQLMDVFSFLNCPNISEYSVSEENRNYISHDGVLYGISKGIPYFHHYPPARKDETYEIMEGVKDIIGKFEYSPYLKKLVIPESVTYISGLSVQDSSIEAFEVAKDNSILKSIDGVLYSKDETVLEYYPNGKKDKIFFCSDYVKTIRCIIRNPYLEEIYISPEVEKLEAWCFEGLTSIKKIIFASDCKIETIPDGCFINWHGESPLEAICFPAGVKKYDQRYYGVFFGCNALKQIYFAEGSSVYETGEGLAGTDYVFRYEFVDYVPCTIYGHGSGNKIYAFAEENGKEYVDVEKTTVPVLGVTFDDFIKKLEPGEQEKLHATAYPFRSPEGKLIFESSNPTVATVDSDGIVTAVSDGECIITASAVDEGGEYARCLIKVAKNVPVKAIRLDQTEVTLVKPTVFTDFESITLHATIEPEEASDPFVLWKSDDEEIATVDASGKITGVSPGETIITAISRDNGITAECKVILKRNHCLDCKKMILKKGRTSVLREIKYGDQAKFSSSNKKVATVTPKGKIKAKRKGTAIITAEFEYGEKLTCRIKVRG